MRKMKVILVLLAIATVVPFFSGCKKGEKDPFLSLRSRDGRLTQKWNLTKVEGSSKSTSNNSSTSGSTTNTSSSTYTYTYAFDGSVFTKTQVKVSTSGATTTTDWNFSDTTVYSTSSFEMEIKEHGSVTFAEKGLITDDNESSSVVDKHDVTSSGVGTWQWLQADARKDQLLVQISGSTFFQSGIYYVYRLAKKELVLKMLTSDSRSDATNTTYTYGSSSTTGTGLGASTSSDDFTYTFEMKK